MMLLELIIGQQVQGRYDWCYLPNANFNPYNSDITMIWDHFQYSDIYLKLYPVCLSWTHKKLLIGFNNLTSSKGQRRNEDWHCQQTKPS